jgi:hypothetical protein
MVSSILLLFSDPDGFFRRDPKEWEGLKVPAAIVLVAGIIGALSAYLVSRTLLTLFPTDLQATSGFVTITGTAGALIGIFISWAVYTIVLYVISLVFMGKGTFRRTLAAVGYGFLPTAIGSLVSLGLYWYYLPTLPVTPVRDLTDLQSAMAGITHTPVFQMTAAVGIIFLLWSASIWIHGIRYSREISLSHAAITVAIPVAVFIVATLFTAGVFG